MKTSTNALTARYCASKGWPCETVQSWRGKVRHDLFGIADSIVVMPQIIFWVQNCSYGTLKSHRDEIEANALLPKLERLAVHVSLWEWRKKKVGRRGLWFLRHQGRYFGQWGEVSEWEGPLDLYPKKTK